MSSLALAFLVAIGARLVLDVWLLVRQIRWVARHRGSVPAPFASTISLAEHEKASDYTRAKARLAILEEIVGSLLLIAWTLGGGLALLDRTARLVSGVPLVHGIVLLLGFALISAALSLPLAIVHTFGLEARFGFNRTTPRLFLVDRLKGVTLMLVLGAPLAAVVLLLMEYAGTRWWIYVWGVWTGFGLLLSWAYPRFVLPWFNRFRPLEEGPLRQRIDALLARTGFVGGGVFVIDGSRRSSHGNAYFTGLGRSKKIALFDTLVARVSEAQIEAVLAHELGHFRLRHVQKGLALNAAVSLAGMALLGWLMGEPWFFAGLGAPEPSLALALLLFMLVTPAFVFPFQPVLMSISRRHEYEADRYAAQHVQAADLSAALVALYRDNHTALSSDPWHSRFHDSHPPPLARIDALARVREMPTAVSAIPTR